MPDREQLEGWNGRGSDHDRIIRMEQIIDGLKGTLSELKITVSELKKSEGDANMERAKLVAWCSGASAAVVTILRLFWPGK